MTMAERPKKVYKPVGFKDPVKGVQRRFSYSRTIMNKETEIPKPLEYEDIDDAFNEFADKLIDLVDDNGRRVPTFTLYSNQRFSEYSQTWSHTDEDGNLLMNFKTVNRQNNPVTGTNQGGFWNIPGNRRYTTHMKTVLDDDGTEHVEVYSVGQPYCVDLTYRINFVTNTYEMINMFNERVHDIFKARQYYIRPNGHFVPLVLDDVVDETAYSIDERKFFVQSITVKAMAYIIHEKDFEVKKFAKEVKLHEDTKRRDVCVDIEEIDGNEENKTEKGLELTVSFGKWEKTAEFEMDTDMSVTEIIRNNVASVRLSINGVPWFIEKGFKMRNGDVVRVRIWAQDQNKPASVIFRGTETGVFVSTEVHEDVSEDEKNHEEISV